MLVDAIHEATGKPVYIKEVATDSEELRISRLLTQEEWADDSRNHCVPLKRVFEDPRNPNVSYMVMPFLRSVNTPPFKSVREIIKFADQILEVITDHFVTFAPNFRHRQGLVFLHEKRVAHRYDSLSRTPQLFDQCPEIVS